MCSTSSNKLLAGLFLVTGILSGCGKRDDFEKVINLGRNDVYIVTGKSASSEQQSKVVVRSPSAPVNVYLVLNTDEYTGLHAQAELQEGKQPSKIFDSRSKIEDVTFDATVPAKTALSVLLENA